MPLPSCNHDKNAWEFCFVRLVEVQNHLESRCREPCASPTIGRNEKGEQAAEDSKGGSTLLGCSFPNSKLSQTWRTFLKNHANKCSIDFFTVPTAAFNILFVLVVLSHSSRKVVHFNVSSNPTAEWQPNRSWTPSPGIRQQSI